MVYIPNEMLNIIFSYMSSSSALIINEQITYYKNFMSFMKEGYENSINDIENNDEDIEFYETNYEQWKEYSFKEYSINKY